MTEGIFPKKAEDTRPDPCAACREIAGELCDAAGWLAGGGLSAEEFRRTLALLEARKLARFGLTLASAVSEGPLVHFSLRFVENGELCASMDVDIDTGAVSLQTTCA